MKVTCPTCGRGTHVEAEIGDFPTRCQRCGGLLRKPPEEAAAQAAGPIKALSLRRVDPPAIPGSRVQRGALAGLLSARPAAEPDSPGIQAPSMTAARETDGAVAVAEPPVVLRPESRREIARVAARQKALRMAQLRGSHQALGALGWLGVIVIGMLMVCAMVLQAHAMWQHP